MSFYFSKKTGSLEQDCKLGKLANISILFHEKWKQKTWNCRFGHIYWNPQFPVFCFHCLCSVETKLIWSHLLNKSLMKNFIYCVVETRNLLHYRSRCLCKYTTWLFFTLFRMLFDDIKLVTKTKFSE